MSAGPTWILMTRNASDSVQIADIPRVVAAMIVDADTGLVRGINVAATAPEARTLAMTMALTQPAGPLPADTPAAVVCTDGDAERAQAELVALLPDQVSPPVHNGVPIDEAEDIFDSFIGHLTGRTQPAQPPDPDDWRLLFSLGHDYALARPWQRWADNEPMDLTVKIGNSRRRYVAVVLGQEGIQRGLVCYPGAALPAAPHHWQPDQPIPVPAGTLFLWLDPPDEVPAEFAGKARRYGWPADAKLLPVCLTANRDGPADLDQIAARRLSVAIAAVLNHSDRAPGNTDRTAGTLRLADGGHASYTVQWAGATAGR